MCAGNEQQLTKVVVLVVPYEVPVPAKREAKSMFRKFGKVVNVLVRPSLSEQSKSLVFCEMETVQ